MASKNKTASVYVGTSGWVNKDWHEHFYPKDLKKDFLIYLSSVFNSVEVNSSFYHLPKPETFSKWKSETPKNFVFAVKLSRYITHIERLRGVKRETERFIKNASFLENKLGVILVQLPPSLPFKLVRVKTFLKNFQEICIKHSIKVKVAVEPRHPSWFKDENLKKIKELFKQMNIAMIFAHSSKFISYEPIDGNITADFIYLRLHGPKEFAASEYGTSGLKKWIALVKKWVKMKLTVFIYFNNDIHGYAAKDALRSLKLLKN